MKNNLRGLRRKGTENLYKGSGQPKNHAFPSHGNGSKAGESGQTGFEKYDPIAEVACELPPRKGSVNKVQTPSFSIAKSQIPVVGRDKANCRGAHRRFDSEFGSLTIPADYPHTRTS